MAVSYNALQLQLQYKKEWYNIISKKEKKEINGRVYVWASKPMQVQPTKGSAVANSNREENPRQEND